MAVKNLRRLRRGERRQQTDSGFPSTPTDVVEAVPIDDNDPLFTFLLATGGPIEVERINLESPALSEIRAQGVQLIVPLIAQGDLIGTLNLGRRLSDQPYSTDDRKLLAGLAGQVAPAIRVAQLVRQQEAEAKERERIDQELRVASLIQQTLLPKELPHLAGWDIEAYYQSARAVGGDFYDFIPLSGDRIGLVIGDVTDKGVPAALVMATTRTTLRGVAAHTDDPGELLFRANNSLIPEIPPAMFVTCLYGVLNTETGELVYANAGHNLPYVRTASGVTELRARGMPLGLLPDMNYEVLTARVELGETMLLTSDGIVEAHSTDGEMFGFPRLQKLVAGHEGGPDLISAILDELHRFQGFDSEQEDDVTMVTVRRLSSALESATAFGDQPGSIARFEFPSALGNERKAMDAVAEVAQGLGFSGERLERLKTAISEATMNAIEHGNKGDPALLVEIDLLANAEKLLIRIRDQGGGKPIGAPVVPDIEAKLAGEQSPRGWGLFLIEQMVDAMRTSVDGHHHIIELEMSRGGN
ncbi:MAG TPA: SpoIIE family protein phosphatase [Acidimicrobiia bacterium]|nr:SpoIIE family protein phosphatase [Acidimicrobiia bacterium]